MPVSGPVVLQFSLVCIIACDIYLILRMNKIIMKQIKRLRRQRSAGCLPKCQRGAASSRWCHGLVSCTHAPASIPGFGSQPDSGPDCLVATDLAR